MGKRLRKYFIEGGIRIKISFKLNIKFGFKTKKHLYLKEILKLIIKYLLKEFLFKRLVALIIKIITNGSFYFYNRMFYFGVKYG